MGRLAPPFLLASLVLYSADPHLRLARITLAEGRVEVEQASGERMAAERNLPVGQGFWVETAAGARAEVELDEGSMARLAPASLVEFSDLTRLSTGQRISLVTLERGTLYVTADPAGLDAFVVEAPGLEATILSGSRLRVEAGEETSAVAILAGRVRFSSPPAELELRAGQTARVNPKVTHQFQLFREITAAEFDGWSEQRDREAADRASGTRLAAFPFGLGELDAAGKWIDAPVRGKVWQPRVSEGWAPFRTGRWRWYDGLGYTWVSTEPWGWLPYHYGRWARLSGAWVWTPGPAEASETGFSPGEVYWLQGAGFVGWGPLAPGEAWRADARPLQYSVANTTFAGYRAGARVLDPEPSPSLPPDPLKAAQFVVAPPAPPQLAAVSRRRRVNPLGTTRIVPIDAERTYDAARVIAQPQGVPGGSEATQIIGAEVLETPTPPSPPSPTYYNYPVATPPPPPPTQYYPVYVPEVVVVESDRPRGFHGGEHHGGGQGYTPSPPSPPPAASAPPRQPAARGGQAPAPRPEPKADSGGPEHHLRRQSPESGDAPARRR